MKSLIIIILALVIINHGQSQNNTKGYTQKKGKQNGSVVKKNQSLGLIEDGSYGSGSVLDIKKSDGTISESQKADGTIKTKTVEKEEIVYTKKTVYKPKVETIPYPTYTYVQPAYVPPPATKTMVTDTFTIPACKIVIYDVPLGWKFVLGTPITNFACLRVIPGGKPELAYKLDERGGGNGMVSLPPRDAFNKDDYNYFVYQNLTNQDIKYSVQRLPK